MIRLFFCGDILLGEDGIAFDPELAELIAGSDLAAANLEGPELGANGKFEPFPKAGPRLRNPRGTVQRLRDAGFHLLTLANNHIGDYGRSGVAATLDACRKAGIAVCGAGLSPREAYAHCRLKIGGRTVGIVAFAENGFGACGSAGAAQWGYAGWRATELVEQLELLRGQCDILIVVAHAGLEDSPVPLPCWRDAYRMLIRAGADWVIGHHPHVVQGSEIYRGKRIDYSLGNFFFDYAGVTGHDALQCAVVAEFPDAGTPHFRRIPCRLDNGRVQIDHGAEEEFARLDAMLLDPVYEKYVTDSCRKSFHEAFLRYFFLAAGAAAGNSPAERLRGAAKSLLVRRDRLDGDRLLMARHLFGNETNREILRIALDATEFFS